ncbi:MAG: glutamate formimidoyltransferase [Phycisphaerae bacterium]|nr:glutamate formimidoyltransferase [Phycisphaerae bacterium]
MPRIVECVPNFSEGRRPEVIDAICSKITAVPGVRLLSREMDADHNRAVITFIGSPDACVRAAIDACEEASRRIDLNTHKGEHPRMGATDVIPFVPVAGVTMDDCVALARRVGEQIGTRLNIPVYLYSYAATRPERQNLPDIRKGEFEGLRDLIGSDPARTPDFGPNAIHPTAGATAVGARDFLVAYNIYLDTDQVDVAKKIAAGIRFSSGGFRFVQAAGFEIAERQCVQVSMNLTNPAKTPLHRVLETVRREAGRFGANITSSEIVGLVPLAVVADAFEYYVQVERWKPDQILETHLLDAETTAGFLESCAARTPTPGGGSVSAYAGALGAAMVAMVARLNDKKSEPGPLHEQIDAAEALMGRLNALVKEDAAAFDAVMAAWKLPDDDPQKPAAKQAAQLRATQTPLETMQRALDVMRLAKDAVQKSKASCLSDGGVAAFMAHAALEGARLNVMINLPEIGDESQREELRRQAASLRDEAAALRREIDALLAGNYG